MELQLGAQVHFVDGEYDDGKGGVIRKSDIGTIERLDDAVDGTTKFWVKFPNWQGFLDAWDLRQAVTESTTVAHQQLPQSEQAGSSTPLPPSASSSPLPASQGEANISRHEALSRQFTPGSIDENLCKARVFNGGKGGQCKVKKAPGSDFCEKDHRTDKLPKFGRVDGLIPENALARFNVSLEPDEPRADQPGSACLHSRRSGDIDERAQEEMTRRFTPEPISPTKCFARTFNGGKGGQCPKPKVSGTDFCEAHGKQDAWSKFGRVDGLIPAKALISFLSHPVNHRPAETSSKPLPHGTVQPRKQDPDIFTVSGVMGDYAQFVNGVYKRTEEKWNGKSVWVSEVSRDICFVYTTGTWRVTTTQCKGEDNCYMRNEGPADDASPVDVVDGWRVAQSFEVQDQVRVEVGSTQEHRPPPHSAGVGFFFVDGVEGDFAKRLNGLYARTEERVQGEVVYAKVEDMFFVQINGVWQIRDISDKCYMKHATETASLSPVGINGQWHVLTQDNFDCQSSIHIKEVTMKESQPPRGATVPGKGDSTPKDGGNESWLGWFQEKFIGPAHHAPHGTSGVHPAEPVQTQQAKGLGKEVTKFVEKNKAKLRAAKADSTLRWSNWQLNLRRLMDELTKTLKGLAGIQDDTILLNFLHLGPDKKVVMDLLEKCGALSVLAEEMCKTCEGEGLMHSKFIESPDSLKDPASSVSEALMHNVSGDGQGGRSRFSSYMSVHRESGVPELVHLDLPKLIRSISCGGLEAFIGAPVAPITGEKKIVTTGVNPDAFSYGASAGAASPRERGSEVKFGPVSVSTVDVGVSDDDVKPNWKELMEQEHCNCGDSQDNFKDDDRGMESTPAKEWAFVTFDPGEAPAEGWPLETTPPYNTHSRKQVPVEDLKKEFPDLEEVEIIALRLYTGPMSIKYNQALRGGVVPHAIPAWERSGDLVNRYVTTLHVLTSGIMKLMSRRQGDGPQEPLYRAVAGGNSGLAGKALGWQMQTLAGMEFGILSTTTQRSAVVGYLAAQSDWQTKVLLEVVGPMCPGAKLSKLSQYPDEDEVCFPPFTVLEVCSRELTGKMVTLRVVPRVILPALTFEEVWYRRRRMMTELCHGLLLDAWRLAHQWNWEALSTWGLQGKMVNNMEVKRALHEVAVDELLGNLKLGGSTSITDGDFVDGIAEGLEVTKQFAPQEDMGPSYDLRAKIEAKLTEAAEDDVAVEEQRRFVQDIESEIYGQICNGFKQKEDWLEASRLCETWDEIRQQLELYAKAKLQEVGKDLAVEEYKAKAQQVKDKFSSLNLTILKEVERKLNLRGKEAAAEDVKDTLREPLERQRKVKDKCSMLENEYKAKEKQWDEDSGAWKDIREACQPQWDWVTSVLSALRANDISKLAQARWTLYPEETEAETAIRLAEEAFRKYQKPSGPLLRKVAEEAFNTQRRDLAATLYLEAHLVEIAEP